MAPISQNYAPHLSTQFFYFLVEPIARTGQKSSFLSHMSSSREQLVSSASDHWTCCDADTCPRLDTCLYLNGSSGQSYPLFSLLSPKITFCLPISTHTPNVRTRFYGFFISLFHLYTFASISRRSIACKQPTQFLLVSSFSFFVLWAMVDEICSSSSILKRAKNEGKGSVKLIAQAREKPKKERVPTV